MTTTGLSAVTITGPKGYNVGGGTRVVPTQRDPDAWTQHSEHSEGGTVETDTARAPRAAPDGSAALEAAPAAVATGQREEDRKPCSPDQTRTHEPDARSHVVDQPDFVKRRRVASADKADRDGDWWPSMSGTSELRRCPTCSMACTVSMARCRNCRDRLKRIESEEFDLERRKLTALDVQRDEGEA